MGGSRPVPAWPLCTAVTIVGPYAVDPRRTVEQPGQMARWLSSRPARCRAGRPPRLRDDRIAIKVCSYRPLAASAPGRIGRPCTVGRRAGRCCGPPVRFARLTHRSPGPAKVRRWQASVRGQAAGPDLDGDAPDQSLRKLAAGRAESVAASSRTSSS
jgi:hypothetical protein